MGEIFEKSPTSGREEEKDGFISVKINLPYELAFKEGEGPITMSL